MVRRGEGVRVGGGGKLCGLKLPFSGTGLLSQRTHLKRIIFQCASANPCTSMHGAKQSRVQQCTGQLLTGGDFEQ